MRRDASYLFSITLCCLGVLRAGESLAHTSMTVAVDSNILVFDDKVLFAQGTGSLTLLNLDTGRILLRKTFPEGTRFSGKFQRTSEGILVANYDRTSLLNTDTLEPAWSIDKSYDAAIGNDFFISHDGYHTISCYEIATGRRVWTTTMQGGWQLLAAGKFTVVSTPLMWDGRHIIKLLQLDTGQEIFQLQAKDDEQFLNVYFDGKSVYALTAAHDAPRVHHEPIPEHLVEIGPDGRKTRTIDFQSAEIIGEYDYKTSRHGFFFEGRYFASDGTVRDAYAHEPNARAAEWGKNDTSTETIPAGVLIERTIRDTAGELGTLLQLVSGDANWTGFVVYYDEARWLGRYTEAQGKLLFASGGGHIECIDIATGKSQWLYVFPVIRRTMSFSRNGMPPMLTEQAAEYRSGLAKLGATSGTLRIPDDTDLMTINLRQIRGTVAYSGTIIVDPMPDDPFADVVPKLVYRAAAFGVFPVVMMGIVVTRVARRARKSTQSGGSWNAIHSKDYRLLSGLAMLLAPAPFFGIMLYGRVDPLTSICLWSVLCLTFVCSLYLGYKATTAAR